MVVVDRKKPVCFDAYSVGQIINAKKTVFRIPITPQPEFTQIYTRKNKKIYEGKKYTWCYRNHISFDTCENIGWIKQFSPYLRGNILRVYEEIRTINALEQEYSFGEVVSENDYLGYQYKSDTTLKYLEYFIPQNDEFHLTSFITHDWKLSVQMPLEATRLFLKVIDIKVERLQSISQEQCVKEGSKCQRQCDDYKKFSEIFYCNCSFGGCVNPYILGFADFWERKHQGKYHNVFGWDANPWVWVVEFEKMPFLEDL